MSLKHLVPFIFATALAAPTTGIAYDKPFMVEVHVGPSSPSETIGDVNTDTGYNFGTSFAYTFLNGVLGVYTDFAFDGYDADGVSNPALKAVWLYSYGLGMEHQGSFPNTRLGYFVRAGLHYSKLLLLDDDDDDIDETRFELGFQTAAGLKLNLSESWALRGGLQYKTFSENLKETNTNNDAELDSLAVTFGATFQF